MFAKPKPANLVVRLGTCLGKLRALPVSWVALLNLTSCVEEALLEGNKGLTKRELDELADLLEATKALANKKFPLLAQKAAQALTNLTKGEPQPTDSVDTLEEESWGDSVVEYEEASESYEETNQPTEQEYLK